MLESRTVRGEHIAIVSELPNGRTTLLQELRQRLDAHDCKVAFVDALTLGPDPTPEQLWGEALAQFGATRAGRSNFDALRRRIAPRKRHILLLRDLQGLVHLPHFRNSDPWGKLRALVLTPGFSLVVTSRIDLVALNAVVQDYNLGSPFFNHLREIVLGPFSPDESRRYLAHHRPGLDPADHEWILRCTGGHPKMLAWLGDALEQSHAAGHKDHRARLHALIRCRQDLRHVFQTAWPFFPWQERWLMLRTAIAQRCGAAPRRPPPPPVAGRVPSHDRLVAILADLGRDLTELLLRGVLPRMHLHSLPGPKASNLDYFMGVADLLLHHGAVPDFLEKVRRARPRDALSDWTPPLAGAPWHFTTEACERLVPRGVLASTAEAPGWRVIPPLFYWWLLDQVQALTAGADPGQWLTQHRLVGHVPDAEVTTLLELVRGPHEAALSRGAVPLVEEESQ